MVKFYLVCADAKRILHTGLIVTLFPLVNTTILRLLLWFGIDILLVYSIRVFTANIQELTPKLQNYGSNN